MVEPHNGEIQTDADDLSTTPPNPVNETTPTAGPGGPWVMPKPVFRKSGGFDPHAVREEFAMFEDTTAVPNKVLEEAADLTAARRSGESAGTTEPALVEPQPDVSEIIADPPIHDPVVSVEPPKGRAGRIVTVLLVILASIAVIAIFLVVVTYLFLSKSGDGSF